MAIITPPNPKFLLTFLLYNFPIIINDTHFFQGMDTSREGTEAFVAVVAPWWSSSFYRYLHGKVPLTLNLKGASPISCASYCTCKLYTPVY